MAHEFVHLDFSLYFWCLIFTPFQLQAASVKDKQKKEKSHCTGCLSNLVLHHACLKWEHSRRCAVSSLGMLTLLLGVKSHLPCASVQAVWGRGRQKGCKEGWSESINAWFSIPRSSQWNDKILMVVHPESVTQLMKVLLCMVLTLKQIKELVTVSPCYLFAF